MTKFEQIYAWNVIDEMMKENNPVYVLDRSKIGDSNAIQAVDSMGFHTVLEIIKRDNSDNRYEFFKKVEENGNRYEFLKKVEEDE